MAQPSVKEIQVAHRIANVEANEESTDNNNATTSTTNQHKPNKFKNTLFLHYTYEKRFASFQRDLHNIYSDVFQGSDAMDLRLIVGHRNSGNTNSELIQKRPNSSLLKPKLLQSKILLLHKLAFSILNDVLSCDNRIQTQWSCNKQTIKITANSCKSFDTIDQNSKIKTIGYILSSMYIAILSV
jgi:hypothetical protein